MNNGKVGYIFINNLLLLTTIYYCIYINNCILYNIIKICKIFLYINVKKCCFRSNIVLLTKIQKQLN